jgi:hypothetical protein
MQSKLVTQNLSQPSSNIAPFASRAASAAGRLRSNGFLGSLPFGACTRRVPHLRDALFRSFIALNEINELVIKIGQNFHFMCLHWLQNSAVALTVGGTGEVRKAFG